MLTHEQRHLLAGIGTRPLIDAILDFDPGLQRIRNSCAGGHLRRHDGAPEWLTVYDTTSEGYVGQETFGAPARVSVTWTQLKAFAADVPAAIREQMAEVVAESRAEAHRVYKWCHCHHGDLERAAACEKSHEGDPFYGGRRHPSDEEDDEHLALDRALYAREKDLVLQALGLVGEPVGQLDLFGDLIGSAT